MHGHGPLISSMMAIYCERKLCRKLSLTGGTEANLLTFRIVRATSWNTYVYSSTAMPFNNIYHVPSPDLNVD